MARLLQDDLGLGPCDRLRADLDLHSRSAAWHPAANGQPHASRTSHVDPDTALDRHAGVQRLARLGPVRHSNPRAAG